MNILMKQRRIVATLATILCLIYTSHVTVQIFSNLNKRSSCPNQRVARKLMESVEEPSPLYEGFKRGQETLLEVAESKQKQYRLDIIENDIARMSNLPVEENADVPEWRKSEKTNYFGCADFDRIPRTRKEVEENLRGNRGISFIKVRIDGETVPGVMKEANRRTVHKGHILKWQAYKNASLYRTVIEEYKYNSAMREILYLSKLRGLKGVPKLLGSCVEELRVRYIVERVNGVTLCNDNGTTLACAAGNHIMEMVKHDPNPQLAALTFAYSSVTFFQQLEERHLFMEDVSGLNFMVTKDWQLYMVDADSLVFYNDSRIYSQVSCNADDHCPAPSGNLWVDMSLNVRIYSNCRDLTGICEDSQCRGFGTELHACGLAQWYMCRLGIFIPQNTAVGKTYKEACSCLRNMFPHKRCTFKRAADIIRKAFSLYLDEHKQTVKIEGNAS